MLAQTPTNKTKLAFESTIIVFKNTHKSFVAAMFVAVVVLISTERLYHPWPH